MNFLLFILFIFLRLCRFAPPTTLPPTPPRLFTITSLLSVSLVSCLFACLFNYFRSNRAYRVFFFLWLTSCSMMPWIHPCFHKWQDFILFIIIIIIDFWFHWVFIAHGLSLAVESRVYSLVEGHGLLIVVASPTAEHRL